MRAYSKDNMMYAPHFFVHRSVPGLVIAGFNAYVA